MLQDFAIIVLIILLIIQSKKLMEAKKDLSQRTNINIPREISLQVEQCQHQLDEINREIAAKGSYLQESLEEKKHLEKLKQLSDKQRKKIALTRKTLKDVSNIIDEYFTEAIPRYNIDMIKHCWNIISELEPTVELKLHSLEYQDLRKEFQKNNKLINEVVSKYVERYTNKTNGALYKLMVIALRAELQNILYSLKYGKLEDGVSSVKNTIHKYITIASEGNQTIVATIVKFIGEIEILFIQAVKIEYEYYIKRERAREEQAMLREQMRQEAEEKKILEDQKQQILKEESKYKSEIENITEQLNNSSDYIKNNQLLIRIRELESQLKSMEDQKEDIVKLQNGKAGYVYIISNLGSFGNNIFKIGMTRRLNPQERVDELGTASVPFRYDVHSFIFSHDAVSLESSLHKQFENQRVNKVNLRKEFFYSSIEELEDFVLKTEPTAQFTRTMLAEQYYQSLTIAAEA